MVLNLPGPIFTLLVAQVKIAVLEPTKPISARFFPIKNCYHRSLQAFDVILQTISSNLNRKAELPAYAFCLAKN